MDRPTLNVVLATVVLHTVLMGVYVGKYGYDVSAFVGARHGATGRPPWEHVTASIGPVGYDGMFYYVVARNPWTAHVALDQPAIRHGRVLYPFLCWLASGGGNPVLLLWAMPAVNLLLIAGLAWLGSWVVLKNGMHIAWGLLLPLAVNACIPALRDLTDNLSTLLVLALLLAWFEDASWWLMSLLALGAALAREQNVLVIGIVLMAAAWKGRRAATLALAVTLMVWLAWVGVLRAVYGEWMFTGSRLVRAVPFEGLAYGWSHLGGVRGSTRLAIVEGLSLSHMAVLMAVAIPAAIRSGNRIVGAVLLLSIPLAVLASASIWSDLIAYRRVLVWLPLGIWLAGIQSRSSWLLWTLAPAGLFSLAAALRYV